MLRRLFRRPKAEVTDVSKVAKPVEHILIAYAVERPGETSLIITSSSPPGPDARDSAPEDTHGMSGAHYVANDDNNGSDASDASSRDDGNDEDGRSDGSDRGDRSDKMGADSLDSFIAYYGVFGRDMVRDAARSPDARGRVRHVLQQRPELPFEVDAVQHAARLWDGEMMTFLLKMQGKKVHLTCGVIEAAITNEAYGVEVMRIIQERGAAIKITERVASAAYLNCKCGRDILLQLLGDPKISVGTGGMEKIVRHFDIALVRVLLDRLDVRVTERMLIAAAGNREGRVILEVLLRHRADVRGVEGITAAAAGNQDAGRKILKFLIESGWNLPATETVWQAAATNEKDGRTIIGLLADHHGGVMNSEKVMVAAIENTETGNLIIEFLLPRTSQFVLTDVMILALVRNRRHPTELLDVFLDKSENEIQFTRRVTPSFNQSWDDKRLWLRGEFSMSDALSYILSGEHKNRVSFTVEGLVGIIGVASYEIICELLDTLGERISITEEMIEAVAETNPTADLIVQRLFDHTPSVQVTERAVVLAAQSDSSRADSLLQAFFKHDSGFPVSPEAVEAATCSRLWAYAIVETLLEQTPTVQITEKAVATAVHDDDTVRILISKCRGEIRLTFRTPRYTWPSINRILSEAQGAAVVGPPIEEVVGLLDPEVLALVLKKNPKPRLLPSTALEGEVVNTLAGKEITQMLLDHGFEIEVTEPVVRSAAGYIEGNKILDLLLRDTERVRVLQSGMEGIVALCPLEIVQLLLETRKEITITTRMIEGAARNSSAVWELLVEFCTDLPPITDGVLQAAASNANTLRWIYSNYANQVVITQQAVENAARHSMAALQVMLERWGEQTYITSKVMEAVASTYFICDTVKMLSDMRPEEVYLSEDFWVAFVQSSGRVREDEVVEQLLEYCDRLLITEDLVTVGVKHEEDRLIKLLEQEKVRLTTGGLTAIAQWLNLETFTTMLDRHRCYVNVTERVMEAAAANPDHGFQIVEFILRTCSESRTWYIGRVIEAAVKNPQAGRDIIELILCELPYSQFATEGVLIAAAGNTNKDMGGKIIELLLKQREDEVVVTAAVIDAAIANSLLESIISELRELLEIDEFPPS
ncbi:hypothetical protein BDW66DRAFT_42930 [Aspergillus desertorum]